MQVVSISEIGKHKIPRNSWPSFFGSWPSFLTLDLDTNYPPPSWALMGEAKGFIYSLASIRFVIKYLVHTSTPLPGAILGGSGIWGHTFRVVPQADAPCPPQSLTAPKGTCPSRAPLVASESDRHRGAGQHHRPPAQCTSHCAPPSFFPSGLSLTSSDSNSGCKRISQKGVKLWSWMYTIF